MGASAPASMGLLRATQIAQEIGTLPSTVNLGLLSPVGATPGGYHLFDVHALDRAREIRRLQREERLTLEEIASRLSADER